MTVQVEFDTRVEPGQPGQVVFRPLAGADSEAYRKLRQRVLDLGEGKFFNSSYDKDRESTTEGHWRERCAQTADRCTIGIFVEGALVGIMGILPYGDPADRTAELESTWIDPEYRGSGIARQAYDQVRQWCLAHGYRYAIIDIRADNARSRAIREKQGAVYLFTRRDVTWADGSVADTVFYLLDYSPGTERTRSLDQATALLEVALRLLRQEQRHEAAAGPSAGS